MPSQLVDSHETLKDCLGKVQLQVKEQLLIFLDLEGIDVSRHGVVALMQLLMPPDPTVYLIDVKVLGSEAFTTSVDGVPNSSLQSTLESTDAVKVIFDVRNDCNALFFQYGIKLGCIIDLQLLEYVTRSPRGRFVNGLARCIDNETTRLPAYMRRWKAQKEEGHRLFNPGKGGNFEVFLQRPLPAAIVTYCEQDVLVMPALLEIYAQRLESHTAAQVQDLVDARIILGQGAEFEGKGRHMAVGPQLRARRDVHDKDLSFPMSAICSSQIDELCRIDDQPKSSVSEPSTQPEELATLECDSVSRDQSGKSTVSVMQPETTQLESATSEIALLDLFDNRPRSRASSDDYNELIKGDHDGDDDGDENIRYRASYYSYGNWGQSDDDDLESKDLTACDKECGYCGRCSY